MGLITEITDEYRSALTHIETYDEPYRVRALMCLKVGKVALVAAAVDTIGLTMTNIILGFEQSQEALQHTLGNVQVYGFASSVTLGLVAIGGIGLAEKHNIASDE